MNAPAWTAPALLLGVVLMIAPWFLPAAPTWSDADAKPRDEAWANLHAAIDRHSPEGDAHAGHTHREPGESPDFKTAKAAYDAQQARFDAAVARPKWIAFGLRTIGVLLASAGVMGYLHSRRGSR